MSSVLDTRRDFTSEVEEAKKESEKILNEKGLQETINFLFLTEKKCRKYNDLNNLKDICLYMLKLCQNLNNFEMLNSTLLLISKKRSQSKTIIQTIVQNSLNFLENEKKEYFDDEKNEITKINLLDTLKIISDGKIFLEGENSKFIFLLSKIKEKNLDFSSACELINNVHVETYGSLNKKEKVLYILYQIEINLKNKNFTRALIHSRKINKKVNFFE